VSAAATIERIRRGEADSSAWSLERAASESAHPEREDGGSQRDDEGATSVECREDGDQREPGRE